MRILHSVASLDPASGGPARSVPQLALALAKLGMEVGLWSPLPSSGGLADLPPAAAGLLRVFSGDFTAALDAFGTPDLVHDHGIWLPCHREVARICRGRGIARVVSPRGMLEPWALNHKKWKKRLAWHLYQKRDLQAAAALHATAESEAAQLSKLGLLQKILVAANGVEVPPLPDPRPLISDVQSSKSKPKTALFLSRIQEVKGLPMLIEAWAEVRPTGWKMRVVGPDEDGHLAELKAKVKAAGVAQEWSFDGPLEGEAKWEAFGAADLFILPTHSENFGIAVAEALAAGVPVITTKGAPWKGLATERCGWWTEVSSRGIAEALQEACTTDAETLQAMGMRGREWMQRDFGWDGIAKEFVECYRWVLGGGPKPGCVVR